MAKLEEFKAIVFDFQSIADFVTIYISEAHAADDWHFVNNPYVIKQHKTIDERFKAADQLNIKGLNCPLLIDDIDGEAEKLYQAWPERLFIILNGRLVYIGDYGPEGYNLNEIRDWLKKFQRKSI